jgi:cytochrome c peroxidase
VKISISLMVILLGAVAIAHPGHHHGEHTNTAKTEEAAPDLKKVYQEINETYVSTVKPIFDQKCAACHSVDVAAPSYASFPIVHWIVEGDRSEAKEHLEISKGFPFAGHGTPKEDLDALKEVVNKNSMPTWLYSFFHPSAKLTEYEKKALLKWISESEKKLASEAPMERPTEHHH